MTSGSIHFNEAVCGRQQDKDRKWQAGQELQCNLISLRFVFIHSLSWQITFEWETQARDDKWERERIGIKGKRGRQDNYIRVWSAVRGGESVCVCLCVCQCALVLPLILLMNLMSWFIVFNLALKCTTGPNEVWAVCVYPWWRTCVWKSVSSLYLTHIQTRLFNYFVQLKDSQALWVRNEYIVWYIILHNKFWPSSLLDLMCETKAESLFT